MEDLFKLKKIVYSQGFSKWDSSGMKSPNTFKLALNHVRIFTIRTFGMFAELKDFKSIQSIHVHSCSSQILTW